MKTRIYFPTAFLVVCLISLGISCSEQLDLQPLGAISPVSASSSKDGIDKLLIGAYAATTGWNTSLSGASAWMTTATNWTYGDVMSDDATKGSVADDQPPLAELEKFSAAGGAANLYLNHKWRSIYEGILRANDVIRILPKSTVFTEGEKNTRMAEARAIRGNFYFDAYKIFKNVPYLDETSAEPGFNAAQIDNISVDVLDKVIEDFVFAKANLPAVQAQKGRFTKWAATAYLGKAYLYKKNYAEAKTEFDQVVGSGLYSLLANFADIYDPSKKDANTEAIYSIKHSIGDGAVADAHGDYGSILNYIQGGPGGCCGFFLATENLANAYKTRNGLPIDDFTGEVKNEYNDDSKTGGNMSDFGIASDDAFTPFAGKLDPRIDYTLGRRGIPFLDWGVHPGMKWIRGPQDGTHYTQMKRFISKANKAQFGGTGAWGETTTAIDYHVIRYADVLLMLAECEVELGNLSRAMELVNLVRDRAINSPKVQNEAGTADAADYDIKLYASADGVFADQTKARDAVRFERRLEMALEGHRFFDIARWGIAAERLTEKKNGEPFSYAKDINFIKGKNEIYAIPQPQIDLSQKDGKSVLTQNPSY